MTIEEIQKKLNNMTKSQLESVCRKIKCPQGTKKQMIVNLLRPFTMNKYGMNPENLNWASVKSPRVSDWGDIRPQKKLTKSQERLEEHAKSLMEKNGKWIYEVYYNDHGDFSGVAKNNKPCCSKCKPLPQTSWWSWSSLTTDRKYRCSPCKKTKDGDKYVIDTERAPELCIPPQGRIV